MKKRNTSKKVQNLKQALTAIQKKSEDLKKLKVLHLGLFGSFARENQKPSSDVDILVEFNEPVGFFHFYDVKIFLESILGRKVDLIVEDALRPEMRERIKEELVSASWE